MYQPVAVLDEVAPSLMVRRLADGVVIPLNAANPDYQACLEFLAQGSPPLPLCEQTGQNTPIQE